MALARGCIVRFTEDDTVPCSGWIEAAIRVLEGHPERVVVNGPVCFSDRDPLIEGSRNGRFGSSLDV
jgi:GT2 family glycosyltransferase